MSLKYTASTVNHPPLKWDLVLHLKQMVEISSQPAKYYFMCFSCMSLTHTDTIQRKQENLEGSGTDSYYSPEVTEWYFFF